MSSPDAMSSLVFLESQDATAPAVSTVQRGESSTAVTKVGVGTVQGSVLVLNTTGDSPPISRYTCTGV